MSDNAAILNEAYGLIEQGELARARTLLQPLLESDSQNPDVWWLYTHAAEDENEGRRALERVLALDPQYPGATDLGQRLGVGPRVLKPLKPLPTTPTPATPTPVVPAPVTPAPVLTSPSDPDLDDDDFAETATPASEGRRFPSLLMIAGLAIIIVGVLWFAATMLNQPTEPTPTAVADLLTPGVDLTLTTDPNAATQDTTFPVVTSEEESFSLTATALVGTGIATTDFTAQVVTEESIESFAQTATAFVVEANATLTASALATEESGLATSESLLPLSTQAILPTEEASPVVTEEIVPVVTEDAIVTPDIVATEDMIVTPDVSPTATEESDLILPTATESASVNTVPTEETGLILTAEATQDPADVLAVKLEALNVTRDDIVVAQTSLGPTLIVEVCAVPVASATSALVSSMNALAETIADVPDVEAVGVNLACDETRPRVIAVSASAAAAYGRGEIDARTYRQGWQPTDLIDEEGNG
jgi:hypothetical protein